MNPQPVACVLAVLYDRLRCHPFKLLCHTKQAKSVSGAPVIAISLPNYYHAHLRCHNGSCGREGLLTSPITVSMLASPLQSSAGI